MPSFYLFSLREKIIKTVFTLAMIVYNFFIIHSTFYLLRAPLRKESFSSNHYTSDASTEPTPQKPKSARLSATPAKRPPPGRINQQERILTSRSATDVTSGLAALPYNSCGVNITIKTPEKLLSPVGSFDHELGELERQLTDTRKSIDAKFYKSLANSSSPFFRPSKGGGPRLSSPSDYSTFSEENDFPVVPGAPVPSFMSSKSQDGGADDLTAGTSSNSRKSSGVGATTRIFHSEVSFEPLKFTSGASSPPQQPNAVSPPQRKLRNRNESMEQAMRNPRKSVEESTAFITPASPTKNTPRHLRNAEPITFEIHAKGGQVTQVKQHNNTTVDSGSFSDSGILLDKKLNGESGEFLLSDNDGPNRKGSLVKTKVREASDIIHERSYGRNSPVLRDVISRKTYSVDHTNANDHAKLSQRFSHQSQSQGSNKPHTSAIQEDRSSSNKDKQQTPSSSLNKSLSNLNKPNSPKLNARDSVLVKALGSAARHKTQVSDPGVSTSPRRSVSYANSNKIILDDSLTDTFAKLESAFSLKPSTPDSSVSARDERRKKRRSYAKRRSRNFEPSSTDSSGDENSSGDSRRRSNGLRIQLKSRHDDPDSCSIASNKSEAEQSLEAAISDFHNSLSTMPQKSKNSSFCSSDQSEDAPKVPSRSRPPNTQNNNNARENRSKSIDFTTSSRVLTGLESKSVGNVEQVKRRSEAKITLTSARPWSPPLKRAQPSANIRQNVSKGARPKALVLVKNNKDTSSRKQTSEEIFEVEEQIITETSVEDQLSPLPVGVISPRNPSVVPHHSRYTNSLPGRSKKRRSSHRSDRERPQPLRSKSSKLHV